MKSYILFSFLFVFVTSASAQSEIDNAWDAYRANNYQKVIDICKKLEAKGDDEARCLLYFAYDKQGKGELGIPYIKIAANNGFSRATYLMGYLYDYGEYFPQDKGKAEQWYKKCISNTQSKDNFRDWARVNLSLIYLNSNRKNEARPLLNDAFKNGEKKVAPRILAENFFKGKDDSRAVGLFRIAAENGDKFAQCELGKYFEEGKFVEKDYGEAAKWYLLAAEQGDWEAQDNLGSCFEKKYRKTLDERDLKQCLKWYYIPRKDKRIISLGHIDDIKKTEDGGWIIEEEDLDEANPLKPFYDEGCLNARKYKSFTEWQDSVVAKLAVDSDVDINIPNNKQNNKGVYALIISNENYNFEQYVSYAENDGNVFKKYCERTLGIPSKNIHLVVDAGLNKMKRELDWLIEMVTAKSAKKIIFYYTGHGMPADDLSTSYLLPVDGYAKNKTTGFDLNSIYSMLAKVDAESLVILDACFSGTNKKGVVMEKSKGVAVKVNKTKPQGKMIVLSACQSGETAHTYEDQKHSLFTYYLLKTIQESGGKETIGNLYKKVQQRVLKNSVSICGKVQTPDISISNAMVGEWQTSMLVQ